MKQFIEFKRQRELGEIISDTFAFIRVEFKPLINAILKIAGPYLVLFLIALSIYTYMAGGNLNFDLQNPPVDGPFQNLVGLIPAYLLYMVAAILAYTFTVSTALHYMKSYEANRGVVNLEDISSDVKQTFWGFIGLSILKGLTIIVAFALCCLPILYFMVPMAVVLPIYIFTKKDAMDSYSYSYGLIKEEFWITLGTVLLLWIIIMVIGFCFSIPMVIYTWLKMGVFSGELDPGNMNTMRDPIYIILNVLSGFFQFALNIIFLVGSVFIYFNLNERLNFSGTLDRIKSIGQIEE